MHRTSSFFFFNGRESVTKYYENLKMCVENVPSHPLQYCEPITFPDASFANCSSTLFRGGRGEKHKTFEIAVFPIIFVTTSLKNLQRLKCSILEVLLWSQIEGMHLPIESLWYNLNSFCGPNKQLNYLCEGGKKF